MEDLWVFAYGSLMWDPGFAAAEAVAARLYGWHRAMCILSEVYRGRPGNPGLVLGLDRGGSCRGLAYRVAAPVAAAVEQVLHDREMVNNVYRPTRSAIHLTDQRTVRALYFVARRDHRQYAGKLRAIDAARLIRQGFGLSGSSRDYLANTVEHLAALGLEDRALWNLLRLVDEPL
jgi:cation transport protein ChaC